MKGEKMTDKELTVDEIDAEIAALNKKKKEKLIENKASDLELVKKLCKQHGFTATNLRGCLKTKGKKNVDGDEADKQTETKKESAKTTAKTK